MPNGRIVPGNSPVGGINMQALAVVDPQQYPHGLEVTVSLPGALAPLGHVLVQPGHVVAILPPEVSAPVIDAFRQHQARGGRRPGPGEVAAPGLPS